jgi:hypothetical protein
MKSHMAVECGKKDVCDLTGKKISRMEPRLNINDLCLNNNPPEYGGNYTVKYSELDKLKYSIIFNDSMNFNCDYTYVCPHMDEKDDSIIIGETYPSQRCIEVCRECSYDILEGIGISEDRISKVKYWSDTGICIDYIDDYVRTSLSKGTEKGYLLFIGVDNRIYIKLDYINKLYNILDKPNQYQDFYSQMSSDKCYHIPSEVSCISCGKEINDESHVLGDIGFLHPECNEVLKRDIQDLLDTKIDFIISHTV